MDREADGGEFGLDDEFEFDLLPPALKLFILLFMKDANGEKAGSDTHSCVTEVPSVSESMSELA